MNGSHCSATTRCAWLPRSHCKRRLRCTDISDFTIGDFGAVEFPIPERLATATIDALQRGETKYPPSTGLPLLRKAVAAFYERELGLRYPMDGVLITSGSRPGIYATY